MSVLPSRVPIADETEWHNHIRQTVYSRGHFSTFGLARVAGNILFIDSDLRPMFAEILFEHMVEYATERTHYTLHDYQHYPNLAGWPPHDWQMPWHSALGNGLVATALMFMFEATGNKYYNDQSLRYLTAIPSELAARDAQGFVWLREVVDEGLPILGIYNGHFGALGALNEWRLRNSSNVFDSLIHESLDTLKHYLLSALVASGDTFAYYGKELRTPDYGPERALNQAIAAAELRHDLRPMAEAYQSAWRAWQS